MPPLILSIYGIPTDDVHCHETRESTNSGWEKAFKKWSNCLLPNYPRHFFLNLFLSVYSREWVLVTFLLSFNSHEFILISLLKIWKSNALRILIANRTGTVGHILCGVKLTPMSNCFYHFELFYVGLPMPAKICLQNFIFIYLNRQWVCTSVNDYFKMLQVVKFWDWTLQFCQIKHIAFSWWRIDHGMFAKSCWHGKRSSSLFDPKAFKWLYIFMFSLYLNVKNEKSGNSCHPGALRI